MIEDGIVLGAGITIAFARHDVEKLRSLEIANVRQRVDERVEIVAVDRADIVEAEFLEQRARKHHALDVLFSAFRQFVQRTEFCEHFLAAAAHRVVGPRCQHLCEVLVDCADRFGDRHVVVVQNHEQIRAFGVVQRFERHACAHRAVADDRDDVPLRAAELCGDRHSERRRYRCRRMRRSKRVVRRFVAAGEACGTAPLTQPAHRRATAGQDLMGIRLMADVPDDTVTRRIERIVQRDREFYGAEIRRQMAARLSDAVQQERPQFARELR